MSHTQRGVVKRRAFQRLAALASAGAVALSALVGCSPAEPYSTPSYTEPSVDVGGPIVVTPAVQDSQPGQAASVVIYVVDKDRVAGVSRYLGLFIDAQPGVELSAAGEPVLCTSAMVPPGSFFLIDSICRPYTLRIAPEVANEGLTIKLSAQWSNELFSIVDEVTATVEVVARGFSLSASLPDGTKPYSSQVNAVVKAVRGMAPSAPVTLSLDTLGSGVTGAFGASPLAVGNQTALALDIPARYARGATIPIEVHGSSGGISRTAKLTLKIEPLFSVRLAPSSGTVLRNEPIDVDVELSFSNTTFARNGAPPPIVLSVDDLPAFMSATFDNADVIAFDAPVVSARVKRRLRLASTSDTVFSGPIQIRATAREEAADAAGKRPYITAGFALETAAEQSWSYFGGTLNGDRASLGAEPFGIAMGDGTSVVGWLETVGGLRQGRLGRYVNSVFAPLPASSGLGTDGAIRAPGLLPIDSASLALTSNGTAKVAFAYGDGAGIALATADAAWQITNVRQSQFTRGPRLAIAADGSTFVSYVAETHGVDPTGRLVVARPLASLGFETIGGLPGDGALNAAANGLVRAETTAMALTPAGHPVVAWVESQTFGRGGPRLWFRAYDGSAWGPAVQFSTSPYDAALPLRIAVDPGGVIYIAWLQNLPGTAVPRVFAASSRDRGATWSPLPSDGTTTLNIDPSAPARDLSLTVDSLGRPVVAWAEGAARPDIWVRRWNGVRWQLLGAVTGGSPMPVANKSPQIVAGSGSRLVMTWAQLERSDQDVNTPDARGEIVAANWDLF